MNFRSPCFCGTGMLANVVGFPGLIDTRPKWIVPSNRRSITGLKRSLDPIEVPPVVRSKSASWSPLTMTWTCASTLGYCVNRRDLFWWKQKKSWSHSSGTIPRSMTVYPIPSSVARNEGRLVSYIPPHPSLGSGFGDCKSKISLPVLRMATTGLRRTLTYNACCLIV